jgi:hypothetical protein
LELGKIIVFSDTSVRDDSSTVRTFEITIPSYVKSLSTYGAIEIIFPLSSYLLNLIMVACPIEET